MLLLMPKTKRTFLVLLSLLTLTYFGLLAKGSLTRYELFEQEPDLAAYDNTIYNTAQGRWYQSTLSGSVMQFWTTVNEAKPPYKRVRDDFSELGIHANW